MRYLLYILTFALLLCLEIAYIGIARRNHWTTEHNNRADGHPVTVVGGGIIFYIAMLIWSVSTGFMYDSNSLSSNFIVGLTMLAACSFADDLLQLKVGTRLVVQLVATLFLAFQCFSFSIPFWYIPIFLICTVGFINAYNFMDGINGITAAYSLVVLGTFLYINIDIIHFASGSMIALAIISVFIFALFNFRRRALVFAGDVGSISMGYTIAALVVTYMYATADYSGFVFVIVYGVDTTLTVLRRAAEGENIFMPHRKHVYQLLCHVRRVGQLRTASGYALLQLAISIGYLQIPRTCHMGQWIYATAVIAALAVVWFIIVMSTASLQRRCGSRKK